MAHPLAPYVVRNKQNLPTVLTCAVSRIQTATDVPVIGNSRFLIVTFEVAELGEDTGL